MTSAPGFIGLQHGQKCCWAVGGPADWLLPGIGFRPTLAQTLQPAKQTTEVWFFPSDFPLHRANGLLETSNWAKGPVHLVAQSSGSTHGESTLPRCSSKWFRRRGARAARRRRPACGCSTPRHHPQQDNAPVTARNWGVPAGPALASMISRAASGRRPGSRARRLRRRRIMARRCQNPPCTSLGSKPGSTDRALRTHACPAGAVAW
jgi:hypothetical protein